MKFRGPEAIKADNRCDAEATIRKKKRREMASKQPSSTAEIR